MASEAVRGREDLDYAALPPEVNSGRMYAGPGPGSMLVAAQAWDGLAGELYSTAQGFRSVTQGLSSAWQGPSFAAMAAAAAPYGAWMSAAAGQAQQTASQLRAAVGAYEAAFAAVVPPPVIAANRAQLAALVATNLLGQNTPAIMANEARYAQMWAQDAAVMYGYAAHSSNATALKPFTSPPQTTNPAGSANQAASVAQAARTPAGATARELSQLMNALPRTLQSLASGGPSGLLTSAAATPAAPSVSSVVGNIGDYLSFLSGLSFIASGVLYIVGPLTSWIGSGGRGSSCGGSGSGSSAGEGSGGGGSATGGTSAAGTPTRAPTVVGSRSTGASASAGLGRSVPVGGLSVPRGWTRTAPAIRPVAAAMPDVAPTGFPEGGGAGMWPGAIGPAGLTAAAAGGGGAAGSGWAAQRGAAQRDGTPDQRYGNRPAMLPPQVARQAAPRPADQPQGVPYGQPAAGGEGPVTESLREELSALRKQVADLAMERDVLMRSAAMWAQQAADQRPEG